MKVALTILTGILTSPQKGELLYLDPGSGSILIQLIIAGVVGAAFVIRSSWGKIRNFAKKLFKQSEVEEIQEDE